LPLLASNVFHPESKRWCRTNDSKTQDLRVLRMRELQDVLSLSRATIYRIAKKDPSFPMPVRYVSDGRSTGYLLADIEGWLRRKQ